MVSVGRPRKFDRDMAVTVAMKLFWQQGYNATSLADLRQAMGDISAASFYVAFKSKESLFKEALDKYALNCEEVGKHFENMEGNSLDNLQKGLELAVTKQADGREYPLGCMFVLCMPTSSNPKDPVLMAVAAARADARRAIYECVERGVMRGEIRQAVGVDALVTLVDSFVKGLSIQARDGISVNSLLSAIKLIIDTARPDYLNIA